MFVVRPVFSVLTGAVHPYPAGGFVAAQTTGTQPSTSAPRRAKKPFVKPQVEDIGRLTLVTLTTGIGGTG